MGILPASAASRSGTLPPRTCAESSGARGNKASMLLHEQGWPSDVVEKALNHTIGGVRGVYNRAEYAEQRREMLQAWSDYIDGLAPSGNLVIGAG